MPGLGIFSVIDQIDITLDILISRAGVVTGWCFIFINRPKISPGTGLVVKGGSERDRPTGHIPDRF
jgi:hypothetical protein